MNTAPALGHEQDGRVFTLDGWLDAEVYEARRREAERLSDDSIMWSFGGWLFAPLFIVGLVKRWQASSLARPLGVKVSSVAIWDAVAFAVVAVAALALLSGPGDVQPQPLDSTWDATTSQNRDAACILDRTFTYSQVKGSYPGLTYAEWSSFLDGKC